MAQAPSRPDAGNTSAPGNTLGLTALTATAPISWGTTYLVTTEFLPPGYPMVSTVIRALPAGLILLAVTRNLPRGQWLWRSLLLGTLNIGAFNALLFVAAYRLPGGVAATLVAVQPLFVAGLAYLLLSEEPTRWRVGWGLVGVVGVGLIVLRGQISFDLVGVLAGIAAAGVMASGIVLTKRWGHPAGAGAATIAGWQLTLGGLVLVPLALGFEGLRPHWITVRSAATRGCRLWAPCFRTSPGSTASAGCPWSPCRSSPCSRPQSPRSWAGCSSTSR